MAARPPALSASRAKEYIQCPLKFRYQVVDRMVQPPTVATVKGTVVHEALEKLFDLPAESRSADGARALLGPAWQKVLDADSSSAEMFDSPNILETAKADTFQLVDNYFLLEEPKNLNPKGVERFVDVRLETGVLLRGIIDRIDEAPDGRLRVVDYKTGKAPDPRYTADALFQMRFYALLLQEGWRLPSRLQLLYLRAVKTLTLDPEVRDIAQFEQELNQLWGKIKADALAGQFKPKKSRLCDWCSFQDICPAFGGTEPPLPESGRARLLAIETEPASSEEAAT